MATDAQVQNEFRNERHRYKVLLLDNDLYKAREVGKRLENIKNCKVFVCQSEFSALKLLKQENIDIIVMDVDLQNFNGFDFGVSVRTLIRSNLPIIYFGKDIKSQVDHYLLNQENTCYVSSAHEGNELQDRFLEMLDQVDSFEGIAKRKVM